MMLWLLAYILIGQVAVPLVLGCMGIDRLELSVRSHAVLHLCLDVSQLLTTLGILWACLRKYRPRALGLFPLLPLRGLWLLGVLLCAATFPAVDWLAHQSMGWFPNDSDAAWASNLEHSLSVGDWVTNVAYFSVVSLCAPIWEEAIFRGFLLASLAKYMPTAAAAALSSVIFAMCHFRLQTFLPLLVLGVVFSFVFIRTRSLIPPILLHSAWNMQRQRKQEPLQVMMLWLLAYILIGQVAVPLVLGCMGIDRLELSVRSHAVLHLCLDVSQLLTTLGILWACLRKYRPRALGLFPLLPLRGLWLLGVLLCAATFPAVDWLAHQSMGWFPNDSDAAWASNLEHSLSVGDWVTNVAYFSVVSLCAPIWEEAIFRGFLLASLAKYMPTAAAAALSSVIFAMCHFRLQTFLPLLVLGVVFSFVFIRTRSLIPPILLHSAWNMYVLVSLVRSTA
ncbi:putative membrane peptidase ydiL [Tetrabaena socialis]|uniref:Putative membrane peptidase ydiL n=1 Tax=Tetrabaena socialis TaxID=47790 RepID=A0A2J8A8V3_9CHLO|nr:putative membrane peptidase ydiL [Tetrabaena socialis]|eukprot:PNH08949.1 putative membrane peptidase ydiL [Tetrabaena socialis]